MACGPAEQHRCNFSFSFVTGNLRWSRWCSIRKIASKHWYHRLYAWEGISSGAVKNESLCHLSCVSKQTQVNGDARQSTASINLVAWVSFHYNNDSRSKWGWLCLYLRTTKRWVALVFGRIFNFLKTDTLDGDTVTNAFPTEAMRMLGLHSTGVADCKWPVWRWVCHALID